MRRAIGLSLSLVVTLVMGAEASAAVPQLINFQAVLADADGNPIRNSTVSVVFRIYDAASLGAILWEEAQGVETDRLGSFNVLLGSVEPIPDTAFLDSARWLGMTVEPDPEMDPRIRLSSVPYAFRVNSVDGAKGGVIRGSLEGVYDATEALKRTTQHPGVPTIQAGWPQGGWQLNNQPAGTPGSIHVVDGSGTNVVIDLDGATGGITASGNVGIGIANPTERLEVDGVVHSTTGGFRFPDGTIQTAAAMSSGWVDDGAAVRLQDDTDNVGIGTTNPGEKLSVAGLVESTSGGFKFPDGSIQTTATSVGGITIMTGTAAHNTLIAPPPGYSVAQCKCIVSPHTSGPSGSSQEAYRHWCYVTQEAGGWRVYATSQNAHYGGFDDDIANYMIIGVR